MSKTLVRGGWRRAPRGTAAAAALVGAFLRTSTRPTSNILFLRILCETVCITSVHTEGQLCFSAAECSFTVALLWKILFLRILCASV